MEIDIPESIDYLQNEHQQSHTESGTQVQPTQRQTSAHMDNLSHAHVDENTTHFEESNRIEDTGVSSNVPVETYKLVFDNIDKTVKPRYMRLESQTKSLHYVQLYAVKDRVNLSHLSQVPPVVSDIDLSLILPSGDDNKAIIDNIVILIARIMTKHIPYFSEDFSRLVPSHILHEYSCEMAKKSEVVSYSSMLYMYIILTTNYFY